MKRESPVLICVISYLAFILTWGLSAAYRPPVGNPPSALYELIFFIACVGLTGILLPLILSRKLNLIFNEETSRNALAAGIISFTAALITEIAFYSSWVKIVVENPETLIRLKYIMITLPLAAALSLQFFFLIPAAMKTSFRRVTASLTIKLLLPALSFGAVLYLHSGQGSIREFLLMTLIGLFLAMGFHLTRKFFLTYLALFLAVYANSLARDMYIDYSWTAAITGFLFFFILLCAGWFSRERIGSGS